MEEKKDVTECPDGYRRIRCNLCNADDYDVVFPATNLAVRESDLADRFRSSGDEVLRDQVVKCRGCGLTYINPVLDPALILKGYSDGTDQTFVAQNRGREHTFAKGLKFIERFLPSRGRVLDVGTAGGAFLHEASKRGWKVDGCEPNVWLARWAADNYGLPVRPGTIFDIPAEDGAYDLITLWDVLEHTSDPKAVLERCRRLLRPGGVLVVNIPDIGTWIARLMGRRWPFYLSVHLYYFTTATCRRMLEISGFEVLKRRPHFQYLECGYVLKRAEATAGGLARFAGKVAQFLRLNNVLVPYWIGQTLLLARRKD